MKALVRIFVPSESANEKIFRGIVRRCRQATEQFLCDRFGGCTRTDGIGSWVNENAVTIHDTVVREEVVIFESYVTDFTDENRLDVHKFCVALARDLAQDVVLFTVTEVNTIRFVSQETG